VLKLDAGTPDRALASRAAEGPFKDLADLRGAPGLRRSVRRSFGQEPRRSSAAGPLARE